MSSASSFEPTPQEYQKILDSFKNEEFRSLFMDYVKEISDPVNKKLYEDELKALEAEKGNNVVFINPSVGFVVKTHLKDNKDKIFINICHSPEIEKATPQRKEKGVNWRIPLSMGKPREDVDHAKQACMVYDCVFNPTTFELAQRDERFKKLLILTAIEQIEGQFNLVISLDYTLPKMKCKGVIPSTVIREKNTTDKILKDTSESKHSLDFVQQMLDKQSNAEKSIKIAEQPSTKPKSIPLSASPAAEEPTRVSKPMYSIIHQGIINDYQNFTNAKEKQIGARPDALCIQIQLPLVSSVAQVELDTSEKTLELNVPNLYHLKVDLPFPVDHENGNAKFEKSRKELIVQLPVIPAAPIVINHEIEFINSNEQEHELELENKKHSLIQELPLSSETLDKVKEGIQEPSLDTIESVEIKESRVPYFYLKQTLDTVYILIPCVQVENESISTDKECIKYSYESQSNSFYIELNFPCNILQETFEKQDSESHRLLTFKKQEPKEWTGLVIKTREGQSFEKKFIELSPIETEIMDKETARDVLIASYNSSKTLEEPLEVEQEQGQVEDQQENDKDQRDQEIVECIPIENTDTVITNNESIQNSFIYELDD